MDTIQEISKAVYITCQNGNASMLRSLVDACANLNFYEGSARATPLHIAAQEGHLECAQILLEHGADLNLPMGNGLTPLMVACIHNRKSVAELLIKRNANVNQPRKGGTCNAICFAAAKGHFDLVELLVTNGAEVDSASQSSKSPLITASTDGHLDIVQYLLIQGANVNACDSIGLMALHCACEKGHFAIVEALVSKGANVDAWSGNGTPLTIAIRSQYTDIVRLLLENNADPRIRSLKNESTALHTAAKVGNYAILQLLLDHGAVIEIKDGFGETPLHDAIRKMSDEALQWLLQKGADPNARSHDGTTPLMNAALKGHYKAGELLLEAGAVVDAKDNNLFTALHCAAHNGHAKFVQLLLDKGADPKARTMQNVTALEMATAKGHSGVLKVLIHRNPDDQIGKGSAIATPLIQPCTKSKPEEPPSHFEKIINTDTGQSSKCGFTKILNLIDFKPLVNPNDSPALRTGASSTINELEKAILDHTDVLETELDMTEMEHGLKEIKAVDSRCSFVSARSMLDTLAAGSHSDWAEVLMSLLKTKPHYADLTNSISMALPK